MREWKVIGNAVQHYNWKPEKFSSGVWLLVFRTTEQTALWKKKKIVSPKLSPEYAGTAVCKLIQDYIDIYAVETCSIKLLAMYLDINSQHFDSRRSQ